MFELSWRKIFQNSLFNDIEMYESHIIRINRFMTEEVERFEKEFEEKTKDWPQEHKDEYGEYLSDEYIKISDYLPGIQRKSELISIYSFLEHNLNYTCNLYGDLYDAKLKLKDLSKDKGIIDRARLYLEKVIAIDFPKNSSNWNEIKQVQKIRNAIVHNDGIIKNKKDLEVVRDYYKNRSTIDIDKSGKINLNESFSVDFLETVKHFFEELYNVINSSSKIQNNI